ncbi:MAG: transposase [Bacillota bacterium]|nr:transposase [Bacillota bacterium]
MPRGPGPGSCEECGGCRQGPGEGRVGAGFAEPELVELDAPICTATRCFSIGTAVHAASGRPCCLRGRGAAGKTVVTYVVELQGKIVAQVVPDVRAKTLMPIMYEKVLPGTNVYTDELASS